MTLKKKKSKETAEVFVADEECPHCGNPKVNWCYCTCEDGYLRGTFTVCPECGGRGYFQWCPKCHKGVL